MEVVLLWQESLILIGRREHPRLELGLEVFNCSAFGYNKEISDETPDAILSKGGVTVKAKKASYIFNMCPLEDHLTPRPSQKKRKSKPGKKKRKKQVSLSCTFCIRGSKSHTRSLKLRLPRLLVSGVCLFQ
ncbi:hypothetical protein QQF64_001430 [Cirrhinus molitorella]|uniref:Uncharacterized protein n=1 Tax=Cirrhinus molitorella TaxID=172907 RepID=A0ABR3P0K1_9TELE